jgi:hypothetical protein
LWWRADSGGVSRETPPPKGTTMLVQLDRSHHRKADVTDTGVPVPGLNAGVTAPVISVFGHPGRVAGMGAHLPAGWIVRRPRDLDAVDVDDIVLLSGATVPEVVTARAMLHRRTRVVALVDEEAPPETVAAVLTAGADVCVRGGLPAILASHIVACRRRQSVERRSWAEARQT